MPRKKTAVFVTVITALLVVMVLSVAMSVHHYEKTVLITLDAAGEQAAENETGLAEIRRQLEADKADASTGTMFWNGSVCVTKYRAWGGRTTTYYVCPYLSAVSTETIGDTSALANAGLNRNSTQKETAGSNACDGYVRAKSSLFVSLPITSFAQNVGLIAMT